MIHVINDVAIGRANPLRFCFFLLYKLDELDVLDKLSSPLTN